jgi:dipeptidyl aminopeptidase/acylaminoacyl peptidase
MLARLASPVFHVDKRDPPLLLLHGDQDPQMPVNQALELAGAYQKIKVPVQLEIVHGAAHGGAAFYDEERLAVVKKFLHHYF